MRPRTPSGAGEKVGARESPGEGEVHSSFRPHLSTKAVVLRVTWDFQMARSRMQLAELLVNTPGKPEDFPSGVFPLMTL